jgi:hypothetical protein
MTPSSSLEALAGSSSSSAAGIISPSQDSDDTFIASASGTAAPVFSKALTGSAITAAQGTITTGDKQEPLSSQFSLGQIGTATPVISKALTGQSITSAVGNVGAPGFATLTGISTTVEQGFLGRAIAISGQEITSAQGTITAEKGQVALVGESMTVGQGTLTPSGTQWDPKADPTTAWTRAPDNAAVWTRKPGVTTTWNRK